MVTTVPSLEGQLFLKDPQSIIAYTLRRYSRTPKDTVPILPGLIISLPWQIAQHGKDPDALTSNIQTDLQQVFSRIFQDERRVTVSVTHTSVDVNSYNISLSVIYTVLSGEIQQTGTTITLVNGRLTIPEDTIQWYNKSA